MRFFVPFVLASATISGLACVHEDRKPVTPVLANESRAPSAASRPPQYLVGDPSSTTTHIVPLNGGAQGIVVEKRRVVLARGEPRIAPDQASETIAGVEKLPARFGGGFLFWTDYAIYRADQFDSPLVPIARTPDRVDTISFGPKAMMVRTANGERWGIGLPKGERVPLAPLGLVDVVALDEGRALGFDDRGSVFSSVDQGAHWNDVTAQVKGQPIRVFLHEQELWLEDSNSSAMRLEPDGHLAWFDKAPEDESAEIRPRDPKWRGADYPLRAAIRQGVAIDAETAIVVESGDVYRIDIRTGDVVSVQQGKLPPDASCQGLAVPGDVLFACVSRNNNAGAFVVSHTLSNDGPTIEQSFGTGGLQFFASDDGGLVYGGSCSGTPVGSAPMACVRMPSGTWEERDLSNLGTDAGAGPGDVVVARWVPRGDGRVVAVITDPQPAIYDPVSGSMLVIADELKNVAAKGTMPAYYPGKRYHPPRRFGVAVGVIDSTWSYAGSTLRGTTTGGEAFEVTDEGKIKTSGWDFEATYSQNLGIGRSKDGRLYQTSDHGATWNEVAAPPTGVESLDLGSCSSVGCDFGAFYRIGWQIRPPRVEPPPKPAPPAPAVRHVRGVELSCRSAGPVVQKVLSRTDDSPNDLGLGNVRLAAPSEKNEWQYLHTPGVRGITAAWASGSSDSPDVEGSPALRYLLSGFQAQKDDSDVLVAMGPTKNINFLRRGIAYVPPFDPTGRVVRTGVPLSEAIAAAKRAGVTTDDFLAQDPTENLVGFPITPADPNSVSDIAFQDSTTGLLVAFRGERARLAVRPSPNNDTTPTAFSAVALPGDETAILDSMNGGSDSHVYKIGPNGVVDLFSFAAANATYHPANPDALAIGPKGELGIVRTPSGSDPPSELDPAYVVVQGAPPAQLASWSTVKPADDPACKSEPGGWRTTVQSIGSWIRLQNPELKVDDFPMLARVRWTANRVCLEGFELRLPAVTVAFPQKGMSQQSTPTSTWLVAKGATFARVSVAEGIEWRQPLECTTVTTGP